MTPDLYQQAQLDVTSNQVTRTCQGVTPEQQAAIRSHDWLLDMSDMVFECCRCYAVLQEGERRFTICKGKSNGA